MDERGKALWVFGRRLDERVGVVEIAKLVCLEAVALFGIRQCAVGLRVSGGRSVLAVDNVDELDDDRRVAWICGKLWRREPMYRTELDSIGRGGEPMHVLSLPVIEPSGLLGVIRYGDRVPFSQGLHGDLVMLSTLVSLRLAHLGFAGSADGSGGAQLTRRQYEIVQLAATGFTNDGIARHLRISHNTVKNRLKEAFRRLDVRSRVELVRALDAAPPMIDVPFGITRDGALTITYAEVATPSVRARTSAP